MHVVLARYCYRRSAVCRVSVRPYSVGWNRDGVGFLNRKPAISLKRSKIGPRLLLMTNRKLHTRFRLMPKSTTLDDLEGHYALRFKTRDAPKSSLKSIK